MTLSYTGVRGGLVVVVADDPYAHSSQNEQDSRNWARFAKVPMLEPGDAQECKDFTKIAFELSERFETPVLLKGTTRISHADSLVEEEERKEPGAPLGLDKKEIPKRAMVPVFVRARRKFVEERMRKLEAYANEFPYNAIELNDPKIGVIAAGAAYMFTKEVFPDYSYLKLGMVWPLPKKLIAEFFKKVKRVIIVEELDPFLETEIKALGYKIFHGKDVVPSMYELTPEIVERSLKGKAYREPKMRVNPDDLPKRPPNMCPGCSHRALFYALKKTGAYVFGDIGCYSLAYAPPLESMHANICMGAGVSLAYGAVKGLRQRRAGENLRRHRGLYVPPRGHPGCSRYGLQQRVRDYDHLRQQDDRHDRVQEHPGSGFTIRGEPTNMIDYAQLASALGVRRVRKVDPYNVKETLEVLKEEMAADEASVIITQNGPCMLHRREKRKFEHPFYEIDASVCRGCKGCLGLGCPAISWVEQAGKTRDGKKRKGVVSINRLQCPGCGLCSQVCKFEAILPGKA